MAVNMPELVIDKILKHLPTKVAVQVSFPSRLHLPLVSSEPVLNFDEDDDLDRSRHNLNSYSDDYLHQHNKFINFLQGYSEYRDNKKIIEKLRLHMRMFTGTGPETDIIHRWIELATEGDVKELDISLVNSEQCEEQDMLWYCVPWVFLVNAKSLTSLHMEGVMLPTVPEVIERDLHQVLLRSLKTVSLTNVILYESRYFPTIPLLQNSSSIEYLSLTNCSFEYSLEPWCYVEGNSSLKCLEVKYCKGITRLSVIKSMNLESLTFVSPKCRGVWVRDSYKLKKIDICVDQLRTLYIRHCHRELKATINTQDLELFGFCSSLESQVSINARVHWESIISVSELWDEEWFLSNGTNFSALMDFLKGFGCCKKVWLYTRDSKALIIPKYLRKTIGTMPTPLSKSCFLNVAMPNPPKAGSRDYLDLKDSMNWIAHSSRIVECNRLRLVDCMKIFRNPENY